MLTKIIIIVAIILALGIGIFIKGKDTEIQRIAKEEGLDRWR